MVNHFVPHDAAAGTRRPAASAVDPTPLERPLRLGQVVEEGRQQGVGADAPSGGHGGQRLDGLPT